MDRTITHLDPAIASLNLGDAVISESVLRELNALFPSDFIQDLPTQVGLSLKSKQKAHKSELIFVGGSNLIDPRIPVAGNWKANPAFMRTIADKVACLGVGWTRTEMPNERLARLTLQSLLSQRLMHSVRDSRTEELFNRVGFDNVINTGCPTIWPLTPEFCSSLRREPADTVVLTLTADHAGVSEDGDRKLIALLNDRYDRVMFWAQGRSDRAYFSRLGSPVDVNFVPTNLESYKTLVRSGRVDHVGTRLHGGLCALHGGSRSLILGIDARARSKRADFNIPCVDYGDLDAVDEFATSEYVVAIKHPTEQIDRWRSQFDTETQA